MTYDIHLINFKNVLFWNVNIYARDIYIVLSTEKTRVYMKDFIFHMYKTAW